MFLGQRKKWLAADCLEPTKTGATLADRSRQNGAACAKQAVKTAHQAMPSPLSRRRC